MRQLVVGELQLVDDAGEDGDLAAGHAEGVDLVGADQVDLPAPVARPAAFQAAACGIRRCATARRRSQLRIARPRQRAAWPRPAAAAGGIAGWRPSRPRPPAPGRPAVDDLPTSTPSRCAQAPRRGSSASAARAASRAQRRRAQLADVNGARRFMGTFPRSLPMAEWLRLSAYYSRMSEAAPVSQELKPSWGATLRVYLEPATLRMLFLGFSAGLPLLLVLGTLSFRLREAGIDRTTIGFLSWVGLAYAFKWAWAPLVDRLPIPVLSRLLGRRRAWLLLAQAMVIAGLVGMAFTDPKLSLRDHRVVRAAGGLRLGDAGHRAGRFSHRVGRRATAGGAGRGLPDRLPAGDDLGRRGRAVDRGARRGGRRRRLPARGLANRVPGDGRLDGGGRAHRAAVARAAAQAAAAVEERGRLAARGAGRALRRLPAPLPLAGRADPGADRGLPHQRRGDGHHGQPVLRRHGLHQGRGRGRHQDLRRDHDAGRRFHRRRAWRCAWA